MDGLHPIRACPAVVEFRSRASTGEVSGVKVARSPAADVGSRRLSFSLEVTRACDVCMASFWSTQVWFRDVARASA